MSAALCLAQGGRRHDAEITQVGIPQPTYQVISPEQVKEIYTQEQAVTDIKEKIKDIEDSIKEIKADIDVLKKTNAIFGFWSILQRFSYLGYCVRGLAFGWPSDQSQDPQPSRDHSISVVLAHEPKIISPNPPAAKTKCGLTPPLPPADNLRS
jgi:hypothetical protein